MDKVGKTGFSLQVLASNLSPPLKRGVTFTIFISSGNSSLHNDAWKNKIRAFKFFLKSLKQNSNFFKCPLSDLRQFLTTERPLQMMKNGFISC